MSYVTFHTVFSVITLFLFLFFAFALLTLDKGDRTGHRLLAAFFVSLGFSYLDGACAVFGEFFYTHFPHVFYVGMSFDFLVGPLLLLYIMSRESAGFRVRPRHLLHGIPFALHLLYMTVRYHVYPAATKRALLESWAVLSYAEVVVMSVLVHLHFGVYCFFALRTLSAYRARFRTARGGAFRLSWLQTITVGFFLIWTLRFVNSMLWLQVPDLPLLQHVEVRPVIVVSVFVFACTMFVKAMRRPEVVYHEEKPRYQTAQLSAEEQQAYMEALRGYMERRKPYRDPELDLRALAEGVSLQPHLLSQVLNVCARQNFFDFVNGYRVRACQRLLVDEAHAHKNISEIMYEAGFNSKSVFNTAFKKLTGTTPSQYRKTAARAAEPRRKGEILQRQ